MASRKKRPMLMREVEAGQTVEIVSTDERQLEAARMYGLQTTDLGEEA